MDNGALAQPQTSAPNRGHKTGQVSANRMAALELSLNWQSAHAKHTGCLLAEQLNLWRDLLPAGLEPETVLEVRVLDAWSAGDEPGGHCNDIAQMITIDGPGMQARRRGFSRRRPRK